MSITSIVKKNLEARGITCEIMKQGRIARITVEGQEKLVTEKEVSVRDLAAKASDFQVAQLLTRPILKLRNNEKYATLREVQTHIKDSNTKIAVAVVGFV